MTDLADWDFKQRRVEWVWANPLPVSHGAQLLAAFMAWAGDRHGDVSMTCKQIAHRLGLCSPTTTHDGYAKQAGRVRRWMDELLATGFVRPGWGGRDDEYRVGPPASGPTATITTTPGGT